MRIIGTIEARMGSSRLPGKTMEPVYKDMSLLECVVSRFRACNSLENIVVATTLESKDDCIAEWCKSNRVNFFRGSEKNVLERLVETATHFNADAIVQMGADSAYLDFKLIDMMVTIYKSNKYDYVCNDLVLTYPLGIYGHIVSTEILRMLNKRVDLSENDRSDVVRYIWEHPDIFSIYNHEAPEHYRYPNLRLTVDYPEDIEQARNIYRHFDSVLFSTDQLIYLYKTNPSMYERTSHLVQHSAPFLYK